MRSSPTVRAALIAVTVALTFSLPTPAVGVPAAKAQSAKVLAWGTDHESFFEFEKPSKERHTPGGVALPGGALAVAVSVGAGHTVVIGSDKKLYAWGDNDYGQLGDGTRDYRPKPVAAKLPSGVRPVAIEAGAVQTLMIGSDKKLYAWGNNQAAELGIGKTKPRFSPTPVRVKLPKKVKAVTMSADSQSLVIGSDGKLYAWGFNGSGQVGDGDRHALRPTPHAISLAPGVRAVKVAAGALHSMAIGSDGKLYTWGDNTDGALGTGDTTERRRPTVVALASDVKPIDIGAMAGTSVALGTDHQLYTWGYGYAGTLLDGDGEAHNRLTPAAATLPAGVQPKTLAIGFEHGLLISADDKLYAWGFNNHGQLGDGSTTTRTTLVRIALPKGKKPVAVATGFSKSVALAR